MEALYKKLYDKYKKLKDIKFQEMEELSKDQEAKLVNCLTAAEELIQHLTSENAKLKVQASEMVSKRSTAEDQCLDYLKRLMEENQKNDVLSKEVEKLQKLLHERDLESSYGGKNGSGKINSEAKILYETSNTSLRRSSRKRSRDASPSTDAVPVFSSNAQDHTKQRESSNVPPEKTTWNETVSDSCLPEFCKGRKEEAGSFVDSGGYASCMYQYLAECLVGLELSVDCGADGICLSALHKSSGYSFTLTWIKKASGEGTEILYRVKSLGTLERVAPKFMKGFIIFSNEMFPIFFDKMSLL